MFNSAVFFNRASTAIRTDTGFKALLQYQTAERTYGIAGCLKIV